jgi:hypothetical protein
MNKYVVLSLMLCFVGCQGLIDQQAQKSGGGDSKPNDPKNLPPCASSSTTTENGDVEVNLNSLKDTGVFQGTSLAQSIKFDEDKSITAAVFRFKRVGTPTGTITLKLETANVDGNPDGVSLASVSIDIKTGEAFNITTTPESYSFSFTAPVKLISKTTYWLKLVPSYVQSDTNVIQWLGSSTDAYTSGKWIYEKTTADTWLEHPQGKDGIFKVVCK